jgi:hypothetical protein
VCARFCMRFLYDSNWYNVTAISSHNILKPLFHFTKNNMLSSMYFYFSHDFHYVEIVLIIGFADISTSS